jgi:hypothetical protein
LAERAQAIEYRRKVLRVPTYSKPPRGYSPENLVLNDALTYCDMTTTPTGGVDSVHDRLSEIVKRYGPPSWTTSLTIQTKRRKTKSSSGDSHYLLERAFEKPIQWS